MKNKPIQLDLFNQPSLNVIRPIKKAMNDDVRNCGQSREQIVDHMNDLASRYGVSLVNGNCRALSIETFEKWLNPNETKRCIPLKAVPVFCVAVGMCSAMNVLAQSVGMRIIDDREQKLLAWAEAQMTIKKQRSLVRKLESEL